MSGETIISILRRLFDSQGKNLSAAAAEAVLCMGFTQSDEVRLSELAAKSTSGTLTPAEEEEYDGYIAAADLISLWKSRARLSLKQQSSAA